MLFALSAFLNGWMHLCVICLGNVSDLNNPVSVLVQNVESSLSEVSSLIVHLSSDLSEEFIVVNTGVAISIKPVEQDLDFIYCKIYLELFTGVSELVDVQSLITVSVHDTESSANTNNSKDTSGGECFSEIPY